MVPVIVDLTTLRTKWESRIKKHKDQQRKERERQEKSALARINEEWTLLIECRKRAIRNYCALKTDLVNGEVCVEPNHISSSRSTQQVGYGNLILPKQKKDITIEEKSFIFELSGLQWQELPDSLRDLTYLKEWHIQKTSIQVIPAFIEMFQNLIVLDLSRNCIKELPAAIGKLAKLKELDVSFNKLISVPPDLGNCENLKKLNISNNNELSELPFELRDLQNLTFLDLSSNQFPTIPICVLRMSALECLDISSNKLNDLPQDLDRLHNLQTLFLQKNKMTYLPQILTEMVNLRMLVVSGDNIRSLPSSLLTDPNLKYVDLRETLMDSREDEMLAEVLVDDDDREQFEKEFMQMYFEDLKERDTTPYYTTKVSLSLQL